jgi:hypothetical protein
MDAAETLRVVATALGALSTVLVAVVVVMRWMIAEQLQPIRNEMHATGRDVREMAAELRTRVAQHDRDIADLRGAVRDLHDEKIGRSEADSRIELTVRKIVSADAHRESGAPTARRD